MSTLRDLADQLAKGRMGIDEACRRALETTAGTQRPVHGILSRVLRSTGEVSNELQQLAEHTNTLSREDVGRWTGTLLIVCAQLGAGNLPGVLSLLSRMLEATGGTCPVAARPFVAAMIDVTLAALPPTAQEEAAWLEEARRTFLGRASLRTASEPENSTSEDAAADNGLELHQLGNELLRRGRAVEAIAAFSRAIEVRSQRMRTAPSTDLTNFLAGSYKMRATASMALIRASGPLDPDRLGRAREDIGNAVRLREELLPAHGDDDDFAHDFAMTLWTRAWIEGTAWNFPRALEDLARCETLMRQLVDARGRMGWRSDLAMCLADTVRFGVGLGPGRVDRRLLDLSDECLELYKQLLGAGHSEVRTKCLEFLGHGAAPAAHLLGRPDRSVAFLNAGMDEIEAILTGRPIDATGVAGAAMFFAIPPQVIESLARSGLDKARHTRLQQALMSAQPTGS